MDPMTQNSQPATATVAAAMNATSAPNNMKTLLAPKALPDGFSVRAARMEDVAAVNLLVRATDVAIHGAPDCTEEDIREEWSLPGFDVTRDCWLVEAPGGAVAVYARIWEQNPGTRLGGEWTIHPDHSALRLGHAALSLIEARGEERAVETPPPGRLELGVMCSIADKAKLLVLQGAGFSHSRTFLRMSIDLSGGVAPFRDPSAIAIRPHRLGIDDRAAHATIEASFAEHFGFSPRPFELWWAQHTKHERFDPGYWLHAWDGDKIAGSLLAYDFLDLGFVREIGVREEYRGRGIASGLLLRAFAAFHTRGQNLVVLGVDSANQTGAQRLYERLGMHVDQEHRLHQKVIRQ